MSDVAVQTFPSPPITTSNVRFDQQTSSTTTMATQQQRSTSSIRLRHSIASVPPDLIERTSTISDRVAEDIVRWAVGRGRRSPQHVDEYSETMRRMVAHALDKHSSLFRGLTNRLNTVAATQDLSRAITAVADAEFGDGEASWGRIVALCAFVARLAQHFREKAIEENIEALVEFLRDYLNDRLNAWIATQGGWDQFVRRFPQDTSLEPTIFKGLLATGLALGVYRRRPMTKKRF